MECKGICHDDKAAYFKLTCPGLNKNVSFKMMISKVGRANREYRDICQEQHHYATIAYNSEADVFELDNNGNMVKYQDPHITGVYSIVSFEYEILSSFFENYHITPTWINCHFTWGWFDEETGHWTGAVGKVKLTYFSNENSKEY